MTEHLLRWEVPDFDEVGLGLEVTAYVSIFKPTKPPRPAPPPQPPTP